MTVEPSDQIISILLRMVNTFAVYLVVGSKLFSIVYFLGLSQRWVMVSEYTLVFVGLVAEALISQ